jgi:hypothetical protein
VKPSVAGSPPAGLLIEGTPVAAPAQVTVRGPEVALNQMEEIPTEDVPVWSMRAGEQRTSRPALLSSREITLPGGENVTVKLTLSERNANVTVRVTGEAPLETTFENLPLRMLPPTRGFPYEIELEEANKTVDVTLVGPSDSLKTLARDRVLAYIDVSGLGSEAIEPGASAPYSELVTLGLPPDVRVDSYRITPERITFVLKNPGE